MPFRTLQTINSTSGPYTGLTQIKTALLVNTQH